MAVVSCRRTEIKIENTCTAIRKVVVSLVPDLTYRKTRVIRACGCCFACYSRFNFLPSGPSHVRSRPMEFVSFVKSIPFSKAKPFQVLVSRIADISLSLTSLDSQDSKIPTFHNPMIEHYSVRTGGKNSLLLRALLRRSLWNSREI